MADKEKNQLVLLRKLWDARKAKQGELEALDQEIERVLNGEAGIGETLKRLEAAFDAVWCGRYAPGQTRRYIWRRDQDVPHLKRLLRSLSADELERRFVAYLQNDERFYVAARHPFGLFVASINSHAAVSVIPTAPPFCWHHPVCRDEAMHTTRNGADLLARANAVVVLRQNVSLSGEPMRDD